MKSVGIIGGGITGLTAAFQLQKAGIPFTLYEASDRVGGPIQSVREGQYLAECGPNTILEISPVIFEMVRELGLESRRLYCDPAAANRYIARNGHPVALPTSPLEFLRTPLFSAKAKLRLALEPFIRRSEAHTEESVAEFVIRRLGAEFLDYAINPMVGGVYAGDPVLLSVKHAFPKLHALEQRYGSLIGGQILGARQRKQRGTVSKQNAPKFSFDEGLEVFTRALANRLHDSISLRHRISRLRRTDHGWTVFAKSSGIETADEHSALIIAVPAHNLACLKFEGVDFPSLSALSEIDYPPVASVVLGFRRDQVKHPLDGFGVLVPEAERMNILGTIFSSSLFPRRAPAGFVMLTSYLGGARAPELATCNESILVEHTLRDLSQLLGVTGAPTYRHCFVFKHAIPQYNLGFGRFTDLMTRAEAAAPGLLIGGHCRNGISLGDSIASGHEMAARAQQYLSESSNHTHPENEFAASV
jgi:protoporphyrinogen/coproporphyrinogen III oxidase